MKESLSQFLILLLCISCNTNSMTDKTFTPPTAEKIDHENSYHGSTYTDHYHWLRDDSREDEKVLSYLKAENAYTDSMLMHTKDLQADLFTEMKSRIKEDDESVPVFDKGYFYYSRTEEGKQYAINCRKKGSLDAEEEILIDQNELADGKDYFSMGAFTVNPNHDMLAYSVNFDGSERYTVHVKNLTTGKILSDSVPDISYGLEWANDNKTLFYTKFDEARRPYQVWKHLLGTTADNDELIYEEKDDKFFLGIGKSKDDKYLWMGMNSQITSEYHFLDADNPNGQFQLIEKRKEGVEYGPEHVNGQFYIVTNVDGAKNFKLVKTKVETPSKSNWADVFPYDENIYINGFEPFKNFMVIVERREGQRNIRIIDATTGNAHNMKFDEAVYSVSLGSNPSFETSKLRINYNSLTTPNTVFDYDMATKAFQTMKVQEVPGGYDSSAYTSERTFAEAKDGRKIPLNIVYKKGMKKDGSNPTYLYAYGSYGANLDPWFSTARISLLDRGFIYVVANIRGGSEMGRQWYEEGKFKNKTNTFHDFIACADYLIAEEYTSSNKLIGSGGSAGGLLIGAVSNLAADRFNTLVASVPFVDVINTMMDDSIPLTVIEYDEWGNPNEKDYFDYMMSYSPYDNVSAKDYPNLYITGGLNDPRVQYWEPAKWTAKLRDKKTDNNKLVMRMNMGAGHGGASGRFDALKEVAEEYAFILDNVGLTK